MTKKLSQLALEVREDRAMQLWMDGHGTWRQIGDALEPPMTGSGAHKACRRAIARHGADGRQERIELRDAELAEYADLAMAIHDRHHYVVDQRGQLVAGPDGQPLDDDGPKATAIGLLRQINADRRKLWGDDAPARKRVEVVTDDVLEEAMQVELTKRAALEAQMRGDVGAEG